MTTSKGAKKVHFGRNFAMTAGGVRSMTLAAAISVVCLLLISCLGGVPEEEGVSDDAQSTGGRVSNDESECEAGERECRSSALYECGEDGYWHYVENCPGGCEAGSCIGQRGTVMGTVYLQNSDTPIPGVQVSACGVSDTSDSDGDYKLENVPYGTCDLTAQKSDYEGYAVTIEVNSGTEREDIYLVSNVLSTSLYGYVRAEVTGAGISGAEVVVGDLSDRTDAQGHYQLPTVPQGEYTLEVTAEGYDDFSQILYLSTAEKSFDVDLSATCGDGLIMDAEECDDDNTRSGDGCTEDCIVEYCGDGTEQSSLQVAGTEYYERCDDGNNEDNDGCSATCQNERCGDDICQLNENAESCGSDCPSVCGDAFCTHDENVDSCSLDCSVVCGDDICSAGENVETCPDDCSVVCGDGVCSRQFEHPTSCPEDCPAVCGDGYCTHDEDVDSCSRDCSEVCGDGICSSSTENADACPEDCPDVCGDDFCSSSEDALICPEDCSAVCGDGWCTHSENPDRCPEDCSAVCGDDLCTHDENTESCPDDCSECGDDLCTGNESAVTCPEDCSICGDGICDIFESAIGCPEDCA
jgi:cysteine-rich repeat protein